MPYPGFGYITNGGIIKDQVDGPSTESLTIIGTAVDGPLNVPYRITDANQLSTVFGPTDYSGGYKDPNTGTETLKKNGANLPQAVAAALAEGCTAVYAVRATGSTATASAAFTSYMEIEAIFPGRIYNDVTVTTSVASSQLTIAVSQPINKGGDFSVILAATATIAEAIEAVNTHESNTTIYIEPNGFPLLVNDLANTVPVAVVSLVGGTNGTDAVGEDFATNLSGYASALVKTDTGTFDTLLGRNYHSDQFAIVGLHFDDQIAFTGDTKPNSVTTYTAAEQYQTSIAWDFILFLDQVYADLGPTHGTLGCRPTFFRKESDIVDWVNNNLLATSYGFYSADKKWIKAGPFMYEGFKRNDPVVGVKDLGALLSVTAGDIILVHDGKRDQTDFSVLYGAKQTTIPPERSLVYQAFSSVDAYPTAIPSKYARLLVEGVGYDADLDLSGRGAYVVLTRSARDFGGPLVIFDDPTASYRNQVLRQSQINKVCASIHKDLEGELAKFINQPAGTQVMAAMESAVENVLDGYARSGALRGGKDAGYSYKIHQKNNDNAQGVVRVDLDLDIARAIRRIQLSVSVRQ